jgi:hypothetical protein
MSARILPKLFGTVFLDSCSNYQPGDLPPDGYLAWHAWAEVQRAAGIKQTQCCMCSLWRTPQEMSSKTITHTAWKSNGEAVTFVSPVCKACDASVGK